MTFPIDGTNVLERAYAFGDWLDEWYANLKTVRWDEVVQDPRRSALISVDMVNGFCTEGPLASPRSAACAKPIAQLFRHAHQRGVRNLFFLQEWHNAGAEEFKAFGPHCIAGSREAETIPELAALPFARDVQIWHKNSIHTIVGTQLEPWLEEHREVDTFIAAGVCTDLCTFDLAMDLKLRANAYDVPRRVIVAANTVNTYDLPVQAALKIGALPHPGELLHVLALYQMALNQIEVVREIS